MAVTIIVEDGTGVTDANSYISLADAETYFLTRLNTESWDTDSSVEPAVPRVDDSKNRALVQATRTIDARVTFLGLETIITQALAWPRVGVVYQERSWDSSLVPPDVLDAQCEQALYLLGADRTADYQGAGIKSVNLGDSALEVEFDQTSEAPLLNDTVLDLLGSWASSLGGRRGTIPLVRV